MAIDSLLSSANGRRWGREFPFSGVKREKLAGTAKTNWQRAQRGALNAKTTETGEGLCERDSDDILRQTKGETTGIQAAIQASI